VEYYDRFSRVEDENKKVYYGMISALDDAVEMIMEKLKEHELTEQTFIIFASDNGGATYTGATDNGILKAGKFSQFEGGINIPMIFTWKGVLPEGSVYSNPVSLMDVFTTTIAITGCDLPDNRKYDGINLIPYTLGDSLDLPHNFLYWRTDFNKAIRGKEWKLIWNDRDDQLFLYNLEKDPSELFDLSSLYKEKVEKLKNKFIEWENEMIDPMWPGVMQFRFNIDNETTWWAI
jgi:arylsulfatase A-like enzyme